MPKEFITWGISFLFHWTGVVNPNYEGSSSLRLRLDRDNTVGFLQIPVKRSLYTVDDLISRAHYQVMIMIDFYGHFCAQGRINGPSDLQM